MERQDGLTDADVDEVRAERYAAFRERARQDAEIRVAVQDSKGEVETAPVDPPPVPAAVDFGQEPAAAIVPLRYPLRIGKRRVRRVEIRHADYATALAFVSRSVRHTQVFASMCRLTEEEILALRWPDAEEVFKRCLSLLPDMGD